MRHPIKALKLHRFRVGFLVGLLAAGLVVLSLIPESLCKKVTEYKPFFDYCHIAAYFIVAFMVSLFLRFKRHLAGVKLTTPFIFAIAVIAAISFGAINEGLQHFTSSRMPSWHDFYLNSLGSVAGGIVFIMIKLVMFRFIPRRVSARWLLPDEARATRKDYPWPYHAVPLRDEPMKYSCKQWQQVPQQ